jgi:hypothetical protein
MDRLSSLTSIASRISGADQGLGLRLSALVRFSEAEGFTLATEFVELETGKSADAIDRRPQLAAGLQVQIEELDLTRSRGNHTGLRVERRRPRGGLLHGKGPESQRKEKPGGESLRLGRRRFSSGCWRWGRSVVRSKTTLVTREPSRDEIAEVTSSVRIHGL